MNESFQPKKEESEVKERGFFQKVKETFSDEANVSADIPFIEELNLSKDEIKWISEIKRLSASQKAEVTRNSPFSLSAYELVKLNLFLQRDLKQHGTNFISERVENKIDDFAMDFFAKIREGKLERPNPLKIDESYNKDIARLIDSYPKSRTALDKMSVLSKLLNIIHSGGRNILLEGFFYGVPVDSTEKISDASIRFLNRLNNLGKYQPTKK